MKEKIDFLRRFRGDIEELFEHDQFRFFEELKNLRNGSIGGIGTFLGLKSSTWNPKVIIISPHFNNLDNLVLQWKSVNALVQDRRVEYIVVNNAMYPEDIYSTKKLQDEYLQELKGDSKVRDKIIEFCDQHNITHFDLEHDEVFRYHDNKAEKYIPNFRCGDVFDYSLQKAIKMVKTKQNENAIIVLIDSDIFFYKNIHFGNFVLQNNISIAGAAQIRLSLKKNAAIQYFTNQLNIFVFPNRIPDLDGFSFDIFKKEFIFEKVNYGRGDVGIHTHTWIKEMRKKYKWFNPYFLYRSFALDQENNGELDSSIIRFLRNDKVYGRGTSLPKIFPDVGAMHIHRGGNWNKVDIKTFSKRSEKWKEFWTTRFDILEKLSGL